MDASAECLVCHPPTGWKLCPSCTRAFDRWKRSRANTGCHWSLMSWDARRVHRLTRTAARAEVLELYKPKPPR